MRLFCECGNQLVIAHSVKIDLMSNFTYCNGTLTLTKHQISNSQTVKQKLTIDEIDRLYCNNCGNKYKSIEKLKCQCDECGTKLSLKTVKEIGETIILCDACLAKYKHFQDFKIFGLRGPDIKTRKKRYEESLEEVSAMRDMPEEIQRMYVEGNEGNVAEIPFESREEDSVREELNQAMEDLAGIVEPPAEQTSPEETTSNWTRRWTTSFTSTSSTDNN